MPLTDKQLKREQKEFEKVEKMVAEKQKEGLENWLIKFAEKGDWFLKDYKSKKDDWL